MHDIPYVATVCTAYMKDYIEKLKKAMRVRDGLAYLHLLCPCPTGWGFETNQTNEVATMAVMTNYFPLWESENGKLRITREIKHPLLIGEYTRLLGKFSHLNRTELEEMQKIANIRYARVKALSTMQ
jgi:pyruvate/2-oxoacid:ferredoxin oxidoreductase beta subunit